MAQYSMNAYDADIHIPKFKGLIANCNDPDGNLMYAVEAENVDTTDGFLQPAVDPVTIPLNNLNAFPQNRTIDEIIFDFDTTRCRYWRVKFNNKSASEIERLKLLYTLHYGDGKIPDSPDYKSLVRLVAKVESESLLDNVYIFACGGGLYWWAENPLGCDYYGGDPWEFYGPLPVTGMYCMDGTVRKSTDQNNPFYEGFDKEQTWEEMVEESELRNKVHLVNPNPHWSVVSYQAMETENAEYSSPIPEYNDVQVGIIHHYDKSALYLSNGYGLYVVQIGCDERTGLVSGYDRSVNITCYKIETPSPFTHIETFGERLWGCFGDRLFYSAPYKPYDWGQNNDHPSDGAGEIQEPNWDGDYFTGLRSFGNYLVAFKNHRAWKVSGVDIGTNYIVEQYGFGTPYPNSVVTSGEFIYLATKNGLAYYDGSVIRPMLVDELRELWGTLNLAFAQGFLYDNRKYCLAVPNSGVLIVYDTMDGSVLYYKGMTIVGFEHPILLQNPVALCLENNKSVLKSFGFNAWEKDLKGARATKWVTPWIELGRKDIKKGGFELYFTPEVKGTEPVTFTISIETEKKKKTKTYTVAPNVSETLQGKTKRLHFGGGGRRFRLIIQTPSGTSLKWRLYGGIHIIAEIDKD